MKLLSYVAVAVSSLIATSSVFATGATATIAAVAAVPTLSGTMLVVLSLLLFAVAFRVAKQKNGSASKLFLAMTGITALIAGGSGINLVSEAQAGGTTIQLTPNTTTYTLLNDPENPLSGFDGKLENTSGQPVTLVSLINDDTSVCSVVGVGPCSELTIPFSPPSPPIVIPHGASCEFKCSEPEAPPSITF